MKRLAIVLGMFIVSATAMAVVTQGLKGFVFINSSATVPTCVTAGASGSMCVQNALETNGALDVAGAATLRATATVGTTLDVTGATTLSSLTTTGATTLGSTASITGVLTANKMAYSGTIVDFTSAHEVPIFAKTTGAIKTAANAEQDFFYAGYPGKYFELTQGVGAIPYLRQMA
jgi:hypothetical protein